MICSKMNLKILNILVCMVIKLVSSVRIPTNPCPEIFSYYKDKNAQIYGEATVPYDKSSEMEFSVNASFAAIFTKKVSLRLVMVTTTNELYTADKVIYNVFFPSQEIIPKITQIAFNNAIHCRGPEEPLIPGGSGITNAWSAHIFKYTRTKPVYADPGISDDEIPVKDPNVRRPTVSQPAIRPSVSQPALRPSSTSLPQPQAPPRLPEFLQPFTKSPVKKDDDYDCGISTNGISTYIAGGRKVEEGQYPWLTALFAFDTSAKKYGYKCSATLISEKHVVTAGRCVQYNNVQVVKTKDILLVMGTIDLEQWSTNGAISRKASAVNTHPDYKKNPASAHADISIITMDTPVKFSDVLSPVCLWKGDTDLFPITNMMGTIAGYGQDEDAIRKGEEYVPRARHTDIPIVPQHTCLLSSEYFTKITSDKTFCAGGKGSGPCIGDSGVGFVLPIGGVYHLRGVTSLSSSENGTCYFQKKYAIFCDVAKFMDWVKSCMDGQCS